MSAPRQFAVDVVRQLRDAGYVAYWAGGCVRDELLGKTPKDYDVATSASPDEIRNVFGRRKTLAIGAAFGVITVLGRKKSEGQIEVATFRQDAGYSDGRHPDSVTFSTPEHDAQRRDFTINGLFFDPIEEKVIDFVGGQNDLQARLLRAIGDPEARIDEDKLRMLRAVRFAATYDLNVDPATLTAVQQHAGELRVVSAERIAEEMRRMLRHSHRARAAELLGESNLLQVILPELNATQSNTDLWQQTLDILTVLGEGGSFSAALAALLRACEGLQSHELAGEVGLRWRLANDEKDRTGYLLKHESLIRSAADQPWPDVQRVLIQPHVGELLDYCSAVASIMNDAPQHLEFCRAKLTMPPDELNPPPLITGDDLKRAGIPPGKQYQTLLNHVRDAQLNQQVHTTEEALTLALDLWNAHDK